MDATDDGLVGSCEVCRNDELWETDEEPGFVGVAVVVCGVCGAIYGPGGILLEEGMA